MANPIYADDPDWYERPGETVNLHVDVNPAKHVVPALPWHTGKSMADHVNGRWLQHRYAESTLWGCAVCGRGTNEALCAYCARAQQRDETHAARARQPIGTAPRITTREAWESWADGQPTAEDPYADGHVREYETRIA